MADETLDIKVDDGGSTTTVTNNLEKLATSADGVATSLDRANGAASSSAAGFNTAGDAAAKAGTSVKGYVDASGSYIRQVGAGAAASTTARTANDAMRSSLSAVSIEQGRAAAGYGALNAATTGGASANAAFNASVRGLNTELGTYGTVTTAAATETEAMNGANAAGAGASNAAAAGSRNAAAAHDAAAGAAGRNGGAATGARATYGAFNETILDTIRRLGLLAVAFATIRTAAFASDQINARNSLANLGQTAEQLNNTMKELGVVQAATGIGINTLAAAFRLGSAQMQSLAQGSDTLITTMGQIARLSQQNGAEFNTYSTAANNLFGSFRGGVSTMQTYNAVQAQGEGFSTALLQAFQRLFSVMGSGDAVNAAFQQRLASGNITLVQFSQLVNAASQAMNGNQQVGITLSASYNQLAGALNQYVGSSSEGLTLTNLLSAAMQELAQHPGVVVAGLTAIAGAIAIIGIGAFITALVTLGGALATVGGAIGAVVTIGGVLSGWVAAAVVAVGGLVAWLYKNADAYNQVSDSMGVVSQFNAALAQGIVSVVTWVTTATKAAYDWVTSLSFVQTAINYVSSALGSVGTAIQSWVDSFQKSAADFTSRLDDMNKKVADFGVTTNTTGKPMAQFTKLAQDGSGALTQFAPPTEAATAAVSGLGTALTGTAGAMGTYSTAAGNAANATGTFASAADRLASQMAGTQAGVGEFTQATINATASMSNIEKSSNGAVAGLNAVGAAFRQAGNDAEFFAINSKNANTVSGQIGGSTASGLDLTSLQGLALGTGIPTNSSPNEVINIMTRNAYNLLQNDPTNQAAINYLKGQQDLRKSARDAASAPDAAKYYNDDGSLKTQQELTAANSNNTSATTANTAALRANTAASTSAAQTLPDLVAALDPRNSTTVSGLGANGRPTVGTSVTQTTYLTPQPAAVNDTGPSPDVVATLNGGFAPGPDVSDPGIPGATSTITSPGIAAQMSRAAANVTVNIKADDYGQYQRSSRQIAMDIGTRVAMAAS